LLFSGERCVGRRNGARRSQMGRRAWKRSKLPPARSLPKKAMQPSKEKVNPSSVMGLESSAIRVGAPKGSLTVGRRATKTSRLPSRSELK
jgi:hypothetical protein